MIQNLNDENITKSLGFRKIFSHSKYQRGDCFFDQQYQTPILHFPESGISIYQREEDTLVYQFPISYLEKHISNYLSDITNCIETNTNDVLAFNTHDEFIGRLTGEHPVDKEEVAYTWANYFWENFNRLRQGGSAIFYALGKQEERWCSMLNERNRNIGIVFQTEEIPDYYFLVENMFLDSFPLCPTMAFDINNLDGTSSFEINLR